MISEDVKIGEGTSIPRPELVNLYGCEIGKNCKIASYVEIQKGVKIGDNVKIQSFAFIPEGITIEDNVFIGPHVCFTNDRYPRSTDKDGNLLKEGEWEMSPTKVCKGASIGANSTIICGITIGENAIIGAGSVVTKSIGRDIKAYGNPAIPNFKRSHS